MKTIALVSVAGGTGKTTLTASLAVLLARRHLEVMVIEMDEQNMLGTLLGLRGVAQQGLATHVLDNDAAWHKDTFRNGEGVMFVPFGAPPLNAMFAFDQHLARQPGWLGDKLRDIDLPAKGLILIDTARLPSERALQAMRCADLVLCVTRPDPYGCILMATHYEQLRRHSKQLFVLANGVYPARQLHHDVLAMLKSRIGTDVLLQQRVHLDEVVAESYARGGYFFDDMPHSQTSHDLQGLATWIINWSAHAGAHA